METNGEQVVALITGANSGIGYGIACRLLDEFYLNPQNEYKQLTICITTRSQAKSDSTVTGLSEYALKRLSKQMFKRLILHSITIDLTSLNTVAIAAKTLIGRYERIHYVFCNAAMIAFAGVDAVKAAKQMIFDTMMALTQPDYKMQKIGLLTTAHEALLATVVSESTAAAGPEGDNSNFHSELGTVFCANVFGHYFLVHEIMRLLRSPKNPETLPSRVIWVSSIETYAEAFDINDIQGIRSSMSYESSKTLTDILVLGSYLPQVEQHLRSYVTPPGVTTNSTYMKETKGPLMLLAHPGIVATNIVVVHPILGFLKMLGFRFARYLGSPWHCVTSYIGANSLVWTALTPHVGMVEGKKWGSGCRWNGNEMILETDVKLDVPRLTEDLWSRMESLRQFWAGRLTTSTG